jgi:Flp pilus assembly protein TadG
MRRFTSGERRDGGQILVIFALALTAIVAMTGLVLDGGSTFVQRRNMQNVADNAALSAAYAYGMGGGTSGAQTSARSTAASNGFNDGTGGVSVTLFTNSSGGAGRTFAVTISGPHANNFAGIVGMSTWQVTTTATTKAGWPNAVKGAMPIIFNQKAFAANGAGVGHEATYSEPPSGSQDVPQTPATFNWTMYCDQCNADSNVVSDLIVHGGLSTTTSLNDKISPLNAGSHATLYSDLALYGIGGEFPVPIVDDNGLMVGWAMFHVTGSNGGSTKSISGYFVSPINSNNFLIVDDAPAGGQFGNYTVTLIN